MKLSKRPITQTELDQVIQAMYEHDKENAFDDGMETPTAKVGKKSVKYHLDKFLPHRTCVENAETHEPIFIVLLMDEPNWTNWQYAHDEVFTWEDGRLRRFNHNQ
jgi:hypothetical protein